jgi:hypothetical protein
MEMAQMIRLTKKVESKEKMSVYSKEYRDHIKQLVDLLIEALDYFGYDEIDIKHIRSYRGLLVFYINYPISDPALTSAINASLDDGQIFFVGNRATFCKVYDKNTGKLIEREDIMERLSDLPLHILP